jgi:hypothetical protein
MAEEPITFKGFALGAVRDEFLAAFPGGLCKGAPEHGDSCAWFPSKDCRSSDSESPCFKQFNYGGVLPTFMVVTFRRREFVHVRVTFPEPRFRALREAMTTRFGPPISSKTEVLQNRMGASFESERMSWARDDALLTLAQRSSRLDEGSVSLTSKNFLQSMKEEDKNEAKARAKDL